IRLGGAMGALPNVDSVTLARSYDEGPGRDVLFTVACIIHFRRRSRNLCRARSWWRDDGAAGPRGVLPPRGVAGTWLTGNAQLPGAERTGMCAARAKRCLRWIGRDPERVAGMRSAGSDCGSARGQAGNTPAGRSLARGAADREEVAALGADRAHVDDAVQDRRRGRGVAVVE